MIGSDLRRPMKTFLCTRANRGTEAAAQGQDTVILDAAGDFRQSSTDLVSDIVAFLF